MPCLFLIFYFISILFGCGVSHNATGQQKDFILNSLNFIFTFIECSTVLDLPSIEINTENTKLDSNSPEFIPTHEWQEILPGQ